MARQTRNTEQLRARRRVEIRGRLLEAVERLHVRGEHFSQISVERLITEAGVTRSTFYAYYPDKDALLQELASAVVDELLEHWQQLPVSATREEVGIGMSQIVATYLLHSAVMIAVGNPVPGGDGRARLASLMDRSAQSVAQHIQAGQLEGHIHAQVDAAATAALLVWMTERGLMKLVAPAGPGQVAELTQSLTEIFWRVLYAGAPA